MHVPPAVRQVPGLGGAACISRRRVQPGRSARAGMRAKGLPCMSVYMAQKVGCGWTS